MNTLQRAFSFTRLGLTLTVIGTSWLAGCASAPPSIYSWQGYEQNLDAYFRADKSSQAEQLQQMQQNRQKILSEGKKLPPGYEAHMGLLHAEQGDMVQFENQLRSEKTNFPESTGFIDFLLRNFKKNGS